MPVFTVTANGRIDAVITRALALGSRTQAQRLISAGAVSVRGLPVDRGSFRVKAGDAVVVDDAVMVRALSPSSIEPVNCHLRVLYEDDACLVIQKPANLVMHPTVGVAKREPTVVHGAAYLFRERGIPFSESAVLVHRLDRDTTGCLLLAKTAEAQRALQKQFQDRSVGKTYLALVAGIPFPPAAVIDAGIGRSTANRTKMAVLGASRARTARTTYRTIAAAPQHGAALLACDLHTGRTHQIRVHLATIGHPVIGDPVYASAASKALSARVPFPGINLHAWTLSFCSPTGPVIQVRAPVPEPFLSNAEALGCAAAPLQ